MTLALRLLFAALAATALAAVAVAWRASAREAAIEARYPPVGQILEIGGARVHAQVMGEGPDLVLIHGSNGNVRDMTYRLAPELADRYRVIILDRPGLGYSDPLDPEGASIAEQAIVLADAARALGATKPIVLGHSYGGAVALAWAVHRPDDIAGLVAVAPASNPWNTPLDLLYRVTTGPVGSAVVVPMITALVTEGRVARALRSVFAPQAVPEGYAEGSGIALSLRRGSFRANAKQRANLLDEIRAIEPRYDEIAVPTEIVHGDADTIVSPKIHSEVLVTQIPDANLTLLPGIGHMPQQVVPEAVAAAVDRAAARADLRESR